MPRRKTRPLTIRDVMLIVGMTAGGLALGRTIVADPIILPKSPTWDARPITYFLLAWSLGFLALRLKRPRPPMRRLMCQPGMVACCAVAVVTVIVGISWGFDCFNLEPEHYPSILERYWRNHCDHPGIAVAGMWLGLVLSRRWRAEPSWVDRLGRLIGLLWLLTLLCNLRFGRWPLRLFYAIWMQ